jgi:hypothetical protein
VKPALPVLALGCLLLACLLLATPAGADTPQAPAKDAATLASARELGSEGIALYRQGEYAEALDRLTRAHELVGLTTTGLWRARCLVKLSRWVEADDALVAVSRMELPAGAKPIHVEAKKTAAREHEELSPRIPRLVIAPAADVPADTEVLLDGEVLPRARMGVELRLDPGSHSLEARGSGTSAKKELMLGEGERVRIPLRLVDGERGSVPAFEEDDGPATALGVVGWIAIGVGAAGFVVGGVTGGIALGKKEDLDAACPDRDCPPSHHGDIDSFDTIRTASTASFIAAGIVAALGIGMVIGSSALAPGGADDVGLVVGPDGIRVAF